MRAFAHQLVDRMPPERLEALLDLLDEEFFAAEEIAEINELRHSDEWSDWRGTLETQHRTLNTKHATRNRES